MSRISCSNFSGEIGAGAACESDDSENGRKEDSSESDLTFNSDTSQWTPGSEGEPCWHWSWDSSDFEESDEAYSSNKITDSDRDSHSSYGENAHNSDCDKIDETDSNDRADSDSDTHSSECDENETDSNDMTTDSDRVLHSSYGENTHNSDCDENDETDSNDRATDSDSNSHRSYNIIIYGENDKSDCDEKFNDETDAKYRMTDSDSDSCSCSSSCCSPEECCSHESDSDVCYDSESYSANPAQLVDNDCHDASSVSSLGCTLSSTSIGSLSSSQQLDSSSSSTLTSVTSLGSLNSISLSAESALMEQTSIISSSIISDLSSAASVTSCQNDTEPLTSEADYSCSDEGEEEACLESDAEECDSHSDFSDEIGARANSCENETVIEKDSESDLIFNSDTSQWTPGSDGEPRGYWSSNCEESETNSKVPDRISDSDSDSCSCSCCYCSCEECCSHESDSDVCYDSEDYSSSDEDTADSDYDGDDEDGDDSMICQPAARITSQDSNTTLKLIRVQNVGLVVIAVSKSDLDSRSDSERKSVEESGSLQRLKRLGKEISSAFLKLTCYNA